MFKSLIIPGVMFFLAMMSMLVLHSVAPALLPRQALYFLTAGIVFSLASRVCFETYLAWRWPLFGLLLAGLVLTQLLATITRGTTSWIAVGPFNVQPSQLAVLFISLVIAGRATLAHLSLTSLLITSGALLIPASLIFLEPDLGTTTILLISVGSGMLLLRIPRPFFLSIGVLAVVTVVCAWIFLLKPYQKQRITSFLSLDGNETAAQYHSTQSITAVGSGQLMGLGLGQGTQSQLRFLPERQTDFVFASLAEETGFVGSSLLLGLYGLLFGSCIYMLAQPLSREKHVFILITVTMLLAQIGVNIGMNIGLLPITGITLPLVSYGGSSILAFSLQLGCLQSILTSVEERAVREIR